MATPPRAELLLQLDNIQHDGNLNLLRTAASAHGVPLEFAVAITSRETNCRNILGDKRADGYHGVGLMQADIQHDIARQARDDGSWQTPDGNARLIDFCMGMLASNIATAQGFFDDLVTNEAFQIAADGYNAGMGRADADAEDGGDPDRHTTSHDYGSDVVARMLVFQSLLNPPVGALS